ncbi:MAG TPA: ABC transporter permease subunit [Methylomirabilota bacterium]|nr:ABC transporter permease subunit [Methylomirabilota bacterium]
MRARVFRNPWLPYVLVAPQVLITLVFFFWPAFESLRLSLFRVSPFGDRQVFTGADNFTRLFTSADYLQSIQVSFVFALGVTFLTLASSLALAVLASQKIRGRGVYRSAMLWTYGIAPPVSGIIWLFIFHPSYGLVPYLLSTVTAYELNWLLEGRIAMLLVILAATWARLGYGVAFYLAGLQSIPDSVLEAASVDGAGPVRRFWAITFPLLSPVTFFLFIIMMVFAFFETFGIIHAVTQGGPGNATTIMVYKVYLDGFVNLRLGLSAAESVVLMTMVIVLTMLQFRYTQRKVFY